MGRGFLELCGSMCPAPLYLYTYLLRFETKILLILLNIVVYQAWFLVLTCVAFIWQSAFYLLPLRVLFGPWFYKSDWWWFYKGRGFWIFTPVGFNQTEVFTKLPVTFLFPLGLQSGREEYTNSELVVFCWSHLGHWLHSFSVVPEEEHKVRLRTFEGCRVISKKPFKGLRQRGGS